MDTKEIRQKLKQSLDIAFVRMNVTIYIIFLLIGLLMGLSRPEIIPTTIGTFALCGLIILIPSLKILFIIYRDVTGYRLYKTKLSQPHGGFPRGYMYFTIVLEEGDGSKFIVNTNTIFQSYGTAFGPSMEDYINRETAIAYNENTGTVVVLS